MRLTSHILVKKSALHDKTLCFAIQFKFSAYLNIFFPTELIARIQESKFKWINSNMAIDLGPQVGQLPAFETIKVRGGGQERTVGIIGLLTDDKALYRPGAFNNAVISDVFDCADKMQELLYTQHKVDLVIPMTHQVPS
jgi:2',3'-cyclic-nucleotide 2'-phosphodiesterase (5'-nucleotidase family)